jgi:hypothetical protein
MSEEKRDQERADRNQERSEEARWRVAETGAVEEPTQSAEEDETRSKPRSPIRGPARSE